MENKIVCFYSFIIIFFGYTCAFAQPKDIHLSWNSNNTSKSMTLTWTSDELNLGIMKYGTDSTIFNVKKSKSRYSKSTKSFVHHVTLKNLSPNTTYYYQCGSEDTGMSSISSFQTAPLVGSTQKMVVGVWGDTQNNEFNTQFEKSKIIVDKMLKHPIQFSIHMGDIIDEGSDAESWQAFLTVSQPLNIRAPFMPVTGNHDVVNDESRSDFQKPFPVYNDLFNLPRNNLDYSYDYGNTHFIAISSGHAKGAESTGDFLYAKGSKEYKWLEKDLAKARKNKKIKWIILYMHHPLQSYGWSHVKGWQERIAPLVDKYQVDLCLQGHRHVYERHHALRNNEVVGRGDAHLYEKPQGTVYITNGTSGGSPQGLGGHNMASMAFTSNEKMYNYAIMTIEGETLYYDVFNQFDERIDYFQIKK